MTADIARRAPAEGLGTALLLGPSSVPAFIATQLTGAVAALVTWRWLFRREQGAPRRRDLR